ncbi:MAG TPA: bifunctional precorrin-2 dehydrogenase/sirohydrochlorin ferrochelatase [Desulfurivibrionaceae bacterium]|nr:bifunctional precorrin-2 dehydrogenase/sirohydrochlorin ferrochelatase [Desulfurivibrionaceae bacterium]
MAFFPICLDIADRHCVVIGGGRVAERKVASLLDCGAAVTVVSPELTEPLRCLADQGKVNWLARPYLAGDLAGAFLVIAATDDPDVQERVHAEAEAGNILLNVADVPKWCNFILPATTRQGDLMLSVSTAGKSPALARRLREGFDREFGPEYAVLVELLGELRQVVLGRGLSHQQNKDVFQRLVEADLAAWLRAGEWQRLRDHVRQQLNDEAAVAVVDAIEAKAEALLKGE